MDSKQDLGLTILKNASANLLRLGGAGIVAIFLPPLLVRFLPKDVYGTWALLLQLTLYVTYFDFGIQTAVARFVAHTNELNETEKRDGIVSTAFGLLAAGAVLACLLIAAVAWALPTMFHQMPGALYRPAQLCLLVMGVSLALGLPISVIPALFIGLQRNEIPAALGIANKFLMALLVAGVVLNHTSLVAMGVAAALANLFCYFGSYIAWRTWARQVRIRLALFSKACAREIGRYSATLMVWSMAMLMITGLDLTIVGIFDYKSTAYYAIAASLTNFLAQAYGAIFAALLPASAVLGARCDADGLGRMLISSTRCGMLLLLGMALPLMLAGHLVIRLWVGSDYALHSTAILEVLLLGNVIRLFGLPYSTLLLGTGQQGKVILSPIAEGITNLAASVAGAYLFGAIGVAIGTLIGSFVSVGFHWFYNMPRTTSIAINRPLLAREGLLRPLICVAPFGLVLLLRGAVPSPVSIAISASSAALASIWLFWKYGLLGSERQKLQQVLRIP